ncbi:MAG: FdtA/QdtA family cupin domain-containing protein [Bacteroidales bacterium]|nr:FdtA/QdtA family cupin domain-containing protein [Bacteroidales bacterium]
MEKLTEPKVIEIGKIADPRGNLSVIEGGRTIPFAIGRVFYLYDVPADSSRGGHAHYTDCQFMIAVSGSFDVVLDNGAEQRRYTLNRPYRGLFIPPGFWRTMDNFSAGSVCMVITDNPYDEADYIRDYGRFREHAASSPASFGEK